MSLLMDALKKAEREKNKAASGKTATEKTSEAPAQETPASAIDDLSDSNSTPEKNTENKATNDKVDDNWAFNTGELELEPIAQSDQTRLSEELKDDTTVIEPVPSASPDSDQNDLDDDITLKTDPDLVASDFDHDATLPSERAIQSSLKDYFEASQSITMDQNSVAAAIPDITEPTRSTNAALDTSATHVTAHTIFTAGQTRKASTGLAKYALFGTLFLALGLGAVALYYTAMTPTTIDTPVALPTVAKMIETDRQLQTVEVDVNTASDQPPFEPATLSATAEEDPVISEVVKEVAEYAESETKPQVQTQIELTQNTTQDINEPALPEAKIDIPVTEPAPAKPEPEASAIVQKQEASQTLAEVTPQVINAAPSSYESLNDSVVHYPQTAVTGQIKEEIISSEQPDQQNLSAVNTSPDNLMIEDQPIVVMSAEDFAEGLEAPKSAIKITKARGTVGSRSDLNMAYQAYQAGDYPAAKTIYRKILNSRPDNRDARLGIAAIAVMEGNIETAYRHYLHLLQQNPKDPVVNAALFNLQGNTGENVNESQLKLLLDQNPDSPQVHFSLGSFYAKQARWPDAQQAFFDAFNGDKTNPDYAYNLAVSLDQMGQVKAALDYYRQALKLADKRRVSFNTSQILARIQKLSGIAAK